MRDQCDGCHADSAGSDDDDECMIRHEKCPQRDR